MDVILTGITYSSFSGNVFVSTDSLLLNTFGEKENPIDFYIRGNNRKEKTVCFIRGCE